MSAPKLVQVALRHRSKGVPAGTVVSVSAEQADELVANGNVVRVEAPKSEKPKAAEKD